ncbi:MAG TPA: hypothetical protein VGO06_00620 [Bosea sp. (in: a-proteobacteria)]|jgi:hypothetical protein|uniref:hypothetical protein n=1 Tax=Bosea sp. (in: a-proteobacteria) TaxID=1871050 RepID=UPI002E0F949D|nr:hypothetical protein [Bosea sp. (in: a-proteobacteria)]
MTTNVLYIDDRHRAHILIVPPAPADGQHPFREASFVLITGRLREGQVIEISHRKLGPYLRARGNFLERALIYSDVATLAADLDADVVYRHEDLDQAFDDAREAFEEERSMRLAAATIASATQRSASAFASA